MKLFKLGLLIAVLHGLCFGAIVNFSMSYVGKVAVSETSAFYFRYYILDNARIMPDTMSTHYQLSEILGGTWSHQSSQLWSRANSDDQNFQGLNGYVTAHGDTNVCLFEYDSAAGSISHKGFYSVITSRVNTLIAPDSARYCTLRVVPIPDTAHVDIYPILTWRTAKNDTATYDSIQLNYNPIMGYCIYRSASGFNGWERLVPNGGGGGGVYNLWDDTTHIDSTVPAGSYYYAIRLLYAPSLRIIGTDTLWILSNLSANSYSTGAIGVSEQGSNTAPARLLVYPNPSRGGVKVRYSAFAGQDPACLKIYDSSGQLVRIMPVRSGDTVWKCDDTNGNALPAGVYIVELHAGNDILTEKLILQR